MRDFCFITKIHKKYPRKAKNSAHSTGNKNVRLCPPEKLVGCQYENGTDKRTSEDDVKAELYNVAVGIFLGIDNKMLDVCKNAAYQRFIEICGEEGGCESIEENTNLGTGSLRSKKEQGGSKAGQITIDGKVQWGAVELVSDKMKDLFLGQKDDSAVSYYTIKQKYTTSSGNADESRIEKLVLAELKQEVDRRFKLLATVAYKKSYTIERLHDFYVKWTLKMPTNTTIAPTALVASCDDLRANCMIFNAEECESVIMNRRYENGTIVAMGNSSAKDENKDKDNTNNICKLAGSTCVANENSYYVQDLCGITPNNGGNNGGNGGNGGSNGGNGGGIHNYPQVSNCATWSKVCQSITDKKTCNEQIVEYKDKIIYDACAYNKDTKECVLNQDTFQQGLNCGTTPNNDGAHNADNHDVEPENDSPGNGNTHTWSSAQIIKPMLIENTTGFSGRFVKNCSEWVNFCAKHNGGDECKAANMIVLYNDKITNITAPCHTYNNKCFASMREGSGVPFWEQCKSIDFTDK